MLYFKKLIIKPIWLVPYGECFVQWTPRLLAWGRSNSSYLYMGKKPWVLMLQECGKRWDWHKSTRDAFCCVTHPLTWKKHFCEYLEPSGLTKFLSLIVWLAVSSAAGMRKQRKLWWLLNGCLDFEKVNEWQWQRRGESRTWLQQSTWNTWVKTSRLRRHP